MIVELCSAKLIAPYFGTGIQVWSATIGITMLGLAVGYFLGGYLSRLPNSNKLLSLLFGGSSIYCILLPIWIGSVLQTLITLPLVFGSIISLILIILPVLICLGAISPILINMLGTKSTNPGKFAGLIYGISTVGGILATFFTGFLLLPTIGVKTSLIGAGIVLFVCMLFTTKIQLKSTPLYLLFILGTVLSLNGKSKFHPSVKVLAESDGLMGNLKVLEHSESLLGGSHRDGRVLLSNNAIQSFMYLEGPGMWEWERNMMTLLGSLPKVDKGLLIGLGGGGMYKGMQSMNIGADVVEIDARIAKYAKEYFKFPKEKTIHIEDGRRFLKKSSKSYDFIIYDAFISESPAEHLLTQEGFLDGIKHLNDEGYILLNFFGHIKGKKGIALKSIVRTIQSLGLSVQLVPTSGSESSRNITVVAGKKPILDFTNTRFDLVSDREKSIIQNATFQLNETQLSEGIILTDDKPILSNLYHNASIDWRQGHNKYYARKIIRN